MSTEQLTKDPDIDCDDGCGEDCAGHKWEVDPHPYNRGDFDTYVTDSDQAARSAFLAAAEQEWDRCEPGEERVIKIRHNKVLP